jgi:hypothetical protein
MAETGNQTIEFLQRKFYNMKGEQMHSQRYLMWKAQLDLRTCRQDAKATGWVDYVGKLYLFCREK